MMQTLEQRNKLRFRCHAFNRIRKSIQSEPTLQRYPARMQMVVEQAAKYCMIVPISKFKAKLLKSYLNSRK